MSWAEAVTSTEMHPLCSLAAFYIRLL